MVRAEDGSARCHRCWAATHRAPCADCGKTRKIVTRTRAGLPLCGSCNPLRGGPVPCGGCGREGIHPTIDADGRPQCASCWRLQRLPCTRCGEVTLVALRWPTGPVCSNCVDDALADPQPCASCASIRPNVAALGTATQCPSCADLRFDYQCVDCGQFTRPLRRGRCLRCRLIAEIRAAAPAGVPEEMAEFVEEALLANPGCGLRILRTPQAAQLLREILGGVPASHRALDRVTRGGHGIPTTRQRAHASAQPFVDADEPQHATGPIDELRTALVVAGILPSREPTLNTYHERVNGLITSVPEPARLIVRRYVRWTVTRPLQQRVDDGVTVTPELVRWPLLRVKVAAQFVAAVTAEGQRLADIRQSQLDAWLAELPSHRAALRGFVHWATSHHYMASNLEIPAASSRELRAAMDDDERLALAQQLLRERIEDPAARFAAVLVLLFGQRVTRLAVLNLEAVAVDDDGRVTLALAETPIRLREPLASLALRVADAAYGRGSKWLFPSSQGNRPLSSERLLERMANVGLQRALEARNGALSTLAAQLPPALLAEQLGLSLSGASNWSKATGATRGEYAALRH